MPRVVGTGRTWVWRQSRCARRSWILIAVAVFMESSAVCFGRPLGADVSRSAICSAPEYRQFDFWAGEWDVYDPDNRDNLEGRSKVDIILGGCALWQVYEGTNGLIAQSLVTYDVSRKLWHQTLVSNRGQLLAIEGRLEGDRMILRGTQPIADGHRVDWRSVWTLRKDGVLESAATSGDGGATWKPVFDILFRRHEP